MRTDEFLREYRVLEEVLSQKYSKSIRHHASVIMEYLNDIESRPYRDQLDLCREIRNMITHNADKFGQAVIEPSEGVLEDLREIIRYAQKPPLALSFATPTERIFKTDPSQLVEPLMRTMDNYGYSHVPVLENKRFLGIFSISTIFSYMLNNSRTAIDEDTRVDQFRAFLPIDKHCSERFLFMDNSVTLHDVKYEFERKGERNSRLAAVFLTKSGSSNQPLSGMITPWDVLRQV